MNKMKIMSAALSAVIALSCAGFAPTNNFYQPSMTIEAATSSEEMTYGDLTYRQVDKDDDGTYDYVEIMGCNENATEVEIPAEIDGLPVKSIFYEAFYGNANLKSIVINEGITRIDNETFCNCISLESVILPDGITNLGGSAFYNCIRLKNINIPEGVTSIGHSTFLNCASLEDITLPDSLSTINAGAFNKCSKLKSINIPASVSSILDYAFNGCASLETITVSENNSHFCEIDGVLFSSDKTTIVEYPASKPDTEYIIPDGVQTLDLGAFDSCQYLENLEIPSSLESIWESALDAPSFKSINVSKDNSKYCSIDGVLFNSEMTRIIKYPGRKEGTEYIIPEGVTNISEAFSSCKNVETVVIPKSLTSISYCAFSDCNSLKKIVLPENVEYISSGSFTNCSNLESVTVENPECEFYSDFFSVRPIIYNGIDETGNYYFSGTIYGHKDSTAQAYAETFGYNFAVIDGDSPVTTAPVTTAPVTTTTTITTTTEVTTPAQPQGDITGDGNINLYDAIDICKFLMNMRTMTDEEKDIADFNCDGTVNLYDVIDIAKKLMGETETNS